MNIEVKKINIHKEKNLKLIENVLKDWFRNPKNLTDFLDVSFYNHPKQKKILASCFEFLSQLSLKPIIDSNHKKIEMKSIIRKYRLKKLQEFMLRKNYS